MFDNKCIYIDKCFLFLCLFTSVFDTINGFFLQSLGFNANVSLLFKVLIITLCLLGLLNYSLKLFIFSVCLLLYGAILSYYHLIASSSGITGFLFDYTHYLKIFTWLILFLYLYKIPWEAHQIDLKKYVTKLMVIYFIVILFNVLIGLLGYGFSTYSSGFGYQGYFSAGNEVAGALVICYAVLSFNAFIQKKYFNYLIIFLLGFSCAFLLGMKTAILGIVLLTVFLFTTNYRGNKPFVIKFVFSFILFSFLLLLFVEIDLERLLYFYDRFNFFLEKSGLVSAVFSGREKYVEIILQGHYFSSSIYELIFGLGRIGLPSISNTMEIDPLDILVWFGSSVFFLWVLSISVIFLLMFFNFLKTKQLYFVFVWLLILFISSIAGHFFVSGMTSTLLPFLIIYSIRNIKSQNERCEI